MTAGQISAIIQCVDQLWGVGAIEIALEANPHEMDKGNWLGYKSAGLNRLSLGLQTFNDQALRFLGRDHSGREARQAIDLAMEIFPNVSADLIFGWRGQTQEKLFDDLSILLRSGVPHISTYQLTIEEGTAFAKAENRGQEKAVSKDESADLYDLVRDNLMDSGFMHYEVSNFAKSGFRSQHNLAYWRGWDYVGVGPGAHGRITIDDVRHATIAHLTPRAYSEAVEKTGSAIDSLEALSGEEAATEYLLMGLRIDEGISISHYEMCAGKRLKRNILDDLKKFGLISIKNDRMSATNAGRLVLNSITERLVLS